MTLRSVGVFTSSRADLGPLGPVIDELHRDPGVDLRVFACLGHLDEKRGRTLGDIDLPSSQVDILPAAASSSSTTALSAAAAMVSSEMALAMDRHETDTLVLLGDRWELLAAATPAILRGVAIVHLHGGEISTGAIDDRIRHAITKLADLHCCATTDSARRLAQLGEEPTRIAVTGAPGLDRHRDVVALTDQELEQLLGVPVVKPLAIATYHPETIDADDVEQRSTAVLEAVAAEAGTVVVTHPGVDKGADEVLRAIGAVSARRPNLISIPHIGKDYGRALAAADVMVGNSSSGIWEAATFRLPVVNIGNRQAGRIRGGNVLQAGYESAEIRAAIRLALTEEFRHGIKGLENPYGDGHAAPRIREAILGLPSGRPIPKTFVDVV